jgi:hypothetical protein
MTIVATTAKQIETDLNEVSRKLADVTAEVERLRRELAEVKAAPAGELLSPSRPLDAPHPSAVMEVTAEEYDALAAQLDEPSSPNERLKKTMAAYRASIG